MDEVKQEIVEDKPRPKTMLQQIQEEREKLDSSLKTQSEMLARMEEIAALNLMGGRTDAGSTSEKPKEIDPITYARMALEGKVGQKKN